MNSLLKSTKNKSSESGLKNSVPDFFFYAIIGMVFIDYVRPQEFGLTVLGAIKIKTIVTLILTFSIFKYSKKILKTDRAFQLIIAFTLLTALSVVWAHNIFEPYRYGNIMLWMLIGFIFPFVVIVNSFDRILVFYRFWAIAHTLLALIVIHRGGFGPGGFLYDENDVCLALAMGFPYIFYYYHFPDNKSKQKILLLFMGFIVLLAIIITGSRGSTLGLICGLLAIIAISNKPLKNASIIFLVLVVGSGTLISFLPSEYVSDFSNISNPEDKTGDERLWSWSISWVMFTENPILGVGAGNYPWTNAFYYELSPMYEEGRRYLGGRSAHSVFFTLLPEFGLLGCIIFFALIKICKNRYDAIKNYATEIDDESLREKILLMNKMNIVSLVIFLIGGTFISVIYYTYFWYLIAITVGLHKLVKEKYGNKKNTKVNI